MEYYLRLFGLEASATLEDVKKAYRRLAKELHPDVNKDPQAVVRFQELQQAYDYIVQQFNQPKCSNVGYPYPPYYQGYQPYYSSPYQGYTTEQGGYNGAYTEDSAFQSYDWESWDPDILRKQQEAYEKREAQRAEEARQRAAEEQRKKEAAAPPPVCTLREDMLKVACHEAATESKIRAKGGIVSVEEQLSYDIQQYLGQNRHSSSGVIEKQTVQRKGDRSLLGLFFHYDTKGKNK